MADEEEREDDDAREEGEDGAEGEEGEGGEGEDGSKKKLILIIVAAVVLLLIGAGAGLYFTGMLDGLLGKTPAEEGEHAAADDGHGDNSHDKKKKADKGDSHGGGHGEEGGGGAFLAVPLSPVNINDSGGQSRYLRLSVQLELVDPADKEALEAVMPRVVDQFQTYLRELHVRDLRGSAGIYRLQMELLARVNAAAYPIEVKDVLFQEILVQ